MRVIWNNTVIAESQNTIIIEGNHYFPPEAVNAAYLHTNDHHTTCPWKGVASYYDIVVDGHTNPSAAWTYPNPKEAAEQIRDYIAFWKGVSVVAE